MTQNNSLGITPPTYNCIMFALQNKDAASNFEKLMKNNRVQTAFEKVCSDIGIELHQTDCFEKSDLAIGWWQELGMFRFTYTDYHVVRKFNGTWMEKDKNIPTPNALSSQEIENWSKGEKGVTIVYYTLR